VIGPVTLEITVSYPTPWIVELDQFGLLVVCIDAWSSARLLRCALITGLEFNNLSPLSWTILITQKHHKASQLFLLFLFF